MTLALLGHDFAFEMELIVRVFYPGEKISIVKDMNFTDGNLLVTRVEPIASGRLRLSAEVRLGGFERAAFDEIDAGDSSLCERRLGLLLFKLLSEKTGMNPVWGMLTGIRPVRLCGKWRGEGLDDGKIISRLTRDYLVSGEKARLCLETLKAQEKLLDLNKPGTFSLYVGIPFCPTRCHYCSFVSHDIERAAKLVPEYVRLLCEEIRHIGRIAKKLRLLTVYVGGGTPTALESKQLGSILAAITESFDTRDLLEFTVEAGRADTITSEKLDVIKGAGVGRISINPQSMTDGVLEAIGRRHTAAAVVQSYSLARKAGFACINMDIIAGLPGETAESFAASFDKVIKLSPENITVHALAFKRSSHLRERGVGMAGANGEAASMQAYASETLAGAGYHPYYLYRQKPAVENLENTGYSKPGFECAYNIYSMEDTHTILAAGAGGVTKLVNGNGDIKRIFNHKYPYEYISRFEEILNRKGADICEI